MVRRAGVHRLDAEPLLLPGGILVANHRDAVDIVLVLAQDEMADVGLAQAALLGDGELIGPACPVDAVRLDPADQRRPDAGRLDADRPVRRAAAAKVVAARERQDGDQSELALLRVSEFLEPCQQVPRVSPPPPEPLPE